MKQSFKKIKYILLVLLLLIVNFAIPTKEVAEAKTLRDLKEELAAYEKNLAAGEEQKKLTEQEIANKRANIENINVEISNISKEIVSLNEEIEQLNIEIVEKEKEIKEIMNYYQLSSSESAYLEYVFEAADFTDFIYRMAIAEQLSKYNDQLVEEFHETIKQNEQKKKDLDAKTVTLNEKQKQLEVELSSLGSQLGEIMDENVSIEDDIKSVKKMINTYENIYKCGLDEDLNTCGRGKLPPDTAFYRPVKSGKVSANYGIYYPWGKPQQHYGMDISGTGHGANVYSMANGRVAYITERSSCGGNMVYIHHNVNGNLYTTAYFHLSHINVSVGDTVTTETVIGGVGGNSSYEWWDDCSTGTHLHIQFGYGNTAAGLGFYTRFTAKHFDPRNVLNLPSEGSWFYDRTTKY